MSNLTADDAFRVSLFFSYINKHYEDFIRNAIYALDTIFHYGLTSYVILDEKSDGTKYMREIGSNTISQDLLQMYKERYYSIDYFLWEFRKKAHSAKSNCFFKLSDFMDMEESRNSASEMIITGIP